MWLATRSIFALRRAAASGQGPPSLQGKEMAGVQADIPPMPAVQISRATPLTVAASFFQTGASYNLLTVDR